MNRLESVATLTQRLVLTLVLTVVLAAPASAARLFPTWVAAPTGAQPSAVAAGDFNGDGTPDAAVASLVGNSVRVLLGAPDATFGATQDIAVGSGPRALVAADVTGDGHLDLLVACANAAALDVLVGNGFGGFAAPVAFAAPGGAASLALGDLNQDGALDAVIGGTSSSTVSVLLGNGMGAFSAGASVSVAQPLGVAVGDVDGDGVADVVVADAASNGAVWLQNDGSGILAAPVAVSTGEDPRAVALYDVDADGDLDVLVGDALQPAVDVWRNDGTGGFSGPEPAPTQGVPSSLLLADVTGDGRADVVAGQAAISAITALIADVDGILLEIGTYGTPTGTSALAAADGDNDGDLDLYVTGSLADAVGLLRNTGGAAFGGGMPVGVGLRPVGVALADFNGDHTLDAAVVNADGNSVTILSNSLGHFSDAAEFPAGSSPSGVAAGDFDGDGDADLAVSDFGSGGVTLLANDGTGGFTTSATVATGSGASSVAAADLNGDGALDLVVSAFNANSVRVLRGNGHGVFTPFGGAIAVGTNPTQVRLLDVNADGALDIVTANDGNSTISVALGNGAAGFGAAASTSVSGGAVAVAGGDLAHDGGAPDLVVANDHSNTVTYLRNVAGVLSVASVVPAGRNPLDVQVADIDADGFADVVVTNTLANTVSILPGVAGGGIAAGTAYGTGGGSGHVAVGDLSGHHTKDLFVTGDPTNGTDAWVLENDKLCPAPVIALLGANPMTVECHTAFVDPGATAADHCDDSVPVSVSGAVDANVPGTYTLTYTSVNADGNGAFPVSRQVRVVDTTPPVVTLTGDTLITVTCHGSFTDPGATASDACDAAVAVVVSGGPVDTSVPGDYVLTYAAADVAGNIAASVHRTVRIADVSKPVITLLGTSPMTVECHGTFTDPGATASDNCDANIAVAVSGSVDAATPGNYVLTYTATDNAGNAADAVTRTVVVHDTTPPVITLLGDASMFVGCNGSFTDPGATAADACDASVAVTVSGGPVDVHTAGDYVLTYGAVDAAGNAAVPVTRTVHVANASTPVITLLGTTPVTVECHGSYTDAGATAVDACEGTIAVVASGVVDATVPGTYTVTYTAVNAAGTAAVPVTRTVIVTDTTPPVVTLLGDAAVSVQCHGTFADPGASATDNCDANVAVTVGGSVNPNVQGSYTLTYAAVDASGNNAVPVTRTVNVTDTTPPVITLLGASSLSVQCHGTFADPGATATDNCDANVAVTVSGSVNANVTGSYTLTYNAHDGAGNAAVAVTRIVNVIDTTVPVISLLGTTPVTVECHATYTDAGATASDNCDSNVPVSKSGSVNANVVGTYVLTYTATDAAGNFALPVTRTVQVKDTTPPVLTVNTTPITVTDKDCSGSEPVTLPVATATDACDPHPTVTNNAPSTFPAGKTTVVVYTARDAAGNSATASVSVTVNYGGNIDVSSCYYKTGSGSHPTVTKTYNANICVKAYSTAPGSQVRQKYPYGTIDYTKYPTIWATCTPIATGYTDNNGKCSLNVPSNCDYIVVSNFDADHDGHCDDYTGSNVHSSNQCQESDGSEHHDRCYADYQKDCNGNKRSCTTTRYTGSELLVVQPDYIVWDDSVQVYPYVYESDGDWGVVAALAPPEGFVADHDTLMADVNNEAEAVQFTVQEVGSELVPTVGTLNITHKGRHISLRQPVDIRLTKRYAMRRHFDVNDPRVQRMLIAAPSDTLVAAVATSKKKGRPPVVITSVPSTRPAELAVDPSVVAGVGAVHVKLTLPQGGVQQSGTDLDIAVYDAEGRRLATIIRGGVGAPEGVVSVEWNTRDGDTGRLPSGTYFLRAVSPSAKLSLQKRFVVVQ